MGTLSPLHIIGVECGLYDPQAQDPEEWLHHTHTDIDQCTAITS